MSDKVSYLKEEYKQQAAELDVAEAFIKKGGGGSEPPEGKEMEARVAKLETHVEYIRRDLDSLKEEVVEFRSETKTSVGKVRDNLERDFRLLFGALIVVALGLAGLMAKGFHWI
ncbi:MULTISPECIES: hypothetical protein [unclassified Pseudomonas]|uniref:hypothetical protein n=1 Tax=unclassified Pseudomonas TaxID=196821 RepID=UPI001C484054|nr:MULTISPECIES: hypothetical protein [unclassified Pseudomonas]